MLEPLPERGKLPENILGANNRAISMSKEACK